MYSSNSNSPISYDQTATNGPFLSDETNPNSKQEDILTPLFHLPSPFFHYDHDYAIFLQHFPDLFLHNQPPPAASDEIVSEEAPAAAEAIVTADSSRTEECAATMKQIPRKRSSKRDRHSKINTAQGPRDRRMRLSLEVARNFFDLQDTLGFDKASKTVEWLLAKSKSAIKEITGGLPNTKDNDESSASECEVFSRTNQNPKGKRSTKCFAKGKKIRASQKSAFRPLSRESREKARARARERTIEKKRLEESKKLGFRSTAQEACGEESGNSFYVPTREVEELSSHEHLAGDHSMVITGNWSPSIIFNYQQHSATSQEVNFHDLLEN